MSQVRLGKNWQDQTLEATHLEKDFSELRNIGILLGDKSNGLVDIDIDCQEALSIADRFLPDTECIFGRESRKRSHWIYCVKDCGGRQAFDGPAAEGMLVEYRANGAQTVFPPSTHESNELVSFDVDGDPASAIKEELILCVKKLSAATLIAKHWIAGKRHNLSMALSGALLNSKWSIAEVKWFVESVAIAANDPEIVDRLRATEDASDRFERGENLLGLPTLSELVGEAITSKFAKWLEIGNVPAIGHNKPPTDQSYIRNSDVGNAESFVSLHSKNLRFCFDIGTWLVWNGQSWVLDDKQSLEQKAEETVRSFHQEADSIGDSRDREKFLKWISQSGNRQRIQGMLEQAKSHIGIKSCELDQNHWLLNCDGNMIDLKTGRELASSRAEFCTKSVAVHYTQNAECPEFDMFLDRITDGSRDLQEFIQRAIGYSLTASTEEQCMFIAHGVGANGKSTLLNTLSDLLGGYSLNISVQTILANKYGGGIPNDIARLRGARFVTASEGEAKQNLAESLIKQITGGDTMTARFLNKEFFEFNPVCKLWLMTNHKPCMEAIRSSSTTF